MCLMLEKPFHDGEQSFGASANCHYDEYPARQRSHKRRLTMSRSHYCGRTLVESDSTRRKSFVKRFEQSLQFMQIRAPEDWRTPRRSAFPNLIAPRGSVLECGGPPPLSSTCKMICKYDAPMALYCVVPPWPAKSLLASAR